MDQDQEETAQMGKYELVKKETKRLYNKDKNPSFVLCQSFCDSWSNDRNLQESKLVFVQCFILESNLICHCTLGVKCCHQWLVQVNGLHVDDLQEKGGASPPHSPHTIAVASDHSLPSCVGFLGQ